MTFAFCTCFSGETGTPTYCTGSTYCICLLVETCSICVARTRPTTTIARLLPLRAPEGKGSLAPVNTNAVHHAMSRLIVRPKDVETLQFSLLKQAGRVVYSTCTINPEENKSNVAYPQ
jgi:hypothetical protein